MHTYKSRSWKTLDLHHASAAIYLGALTALNETEH